MKCTGSLVWLSLERVPSETSAFALGLQIWLLLASEHQLSSTAHVCGKVQAEWGSLTLGVCLTELGAFTHDDSYFMASCGGSVPAPSTVSPLPPPDNGI